MTRPVAVEQFYHDGRGPGLVRVHWRQPHGCSPRAIEYRCPNDDALCYVRFLRPQAFLFTPEEVIGYATSDFSGFVDHRPAAALDHGRSTWLLSFSPRHLDRCHHFQLLFYDELLDIICEGLEFRAGPYIESDHAA